MNKIQVAGVSQFDGLRTDTPAIKCPENYSPDCSDLVFVPGGMATRNPFRAQTTFLNNIVYRKEFTCRDGRVQVLALDVTGALYTVAPDGTATQIDQVVAGCKASSVTAYGREYIAFYDSAGGCDAPRQWDGLNCSRVSQGGPGAPPSVSNYAIPTVPLIVGSAGADINITSITPTDPIQVRVAGEDTDLPYGYYAPPTYQTYYTTLTVVTATAHGFGVGDIITIAGSPPWSIGVVPVGVVVDGTTFKVYNESPDATVSTGGTATPSSPLLVRSNNEVTAYTLTPHNLRRGYQATIAGVTPYAENISSIVIDNDLSPGVATVTTPTAHGFSPGARVTIANVAPVIVGGSITNSVTANGQQTVTTASAHGLQIGANVLVQTGTNPVGVATVVAVLSPTVFIVPNSGPAGSDTSGSVKLNFFVATSSSSYVISGVPSDTTFTVPTGYANGTWISGTLTYPWDGTFYVTSILSTTSFTYKQSGPNAVVHAGAGTVTPKGQIPAGDHLVCQHFITKSGMITAPSPAVKFTASGGQYALVQNLAIGPANVVGRVLSFTGANGSRFYMLLKAGEVNGLQVSTSTRIDDNTTTSVVLDFSDLSLLSGSAIDVPGNNLFQLVALNTPRSVRWYGDRLFWTGEKNVVKGFNNLGMDGGTLFGSVAPLGWTTVDTGGAIAQVGTMPAYVVTGPGTGAISQGAFTTAAGDAELQPNLKYSLRAWTTGSGRWVGTISSASTSFTATATLVGIPNTYSIAQFSVAMPTSIPSDMVLTLQATGLSSGVTGTIRDAQLVYADNPNRATLARSSYTQNPEQYDALTGNIGPNDDTTDLNGLFILQDSLHFLTARRLYTVQQIGNAEPSSWAPYQISDKCGVFHADAVTVGKGWATWGGHDGVFWYQGGIPQKISNVIAPTWRNVASMTNVYDDSQAERVYYGVADVVGAKSLLVYDYHEVPSGGAGKWCPWNRPIAWMSSSASGLVFVAAKTFYQLDTEAGVADDDFGNIGGYYTTPPLGASMFRKEYDYMGLRLSGTGTLTPFLYTHSLATMTHTLTPQDLATDLDTILEWSFNVTGRTLFLKLGQPGVQFNMQDGNVTFQNDPNAPISGTR